MKTDQFTVTLQDHKNFQQHYKIYNEKLYKGTASQYDSSKKLKINRWLNVNKV